jgi:hypothetical protein
VSPLYGDLVDITEGYYDKVQSVNLKGPFDSRCWSAPEWQLVLVVRLST